MGLEKLLEDHIQDETQRDQRLEERLEKLEKRTEELLDIMTQAKGAVSFIKTVAGILAACAAVWAFLNTNFSIVPK